ncbi:MAG: beta-N-acetylhexosaminidase [Clostridia bacterium]
MLSIIPKPNHIKMLEGHMKLNLEAITYHVHKEFEEIGEVISDILKFSTFSCDDMENSSIVFSFEESLANEAYTLCICEDYINIKVSSYSAAVYAIATLRQIINSSEMSDNCVLIPRLEIVNDCPLHSWRGMLLDESRHFFGKDTVKKMLDLMVLYKLNIFHWHLTDDQGWRIEIDKYPLLTEVGSMRKGSQRGNWNSKEIDFTPHGGFYTKDDIREILRYAKLRGIEIVPEIDFPAHCLSAIAAYNYLACREIPCEVPHYFNEVIAKDLGIKNWNRTLCLSKDSVKEFVFDVIDEVCELFPSKYFHVGGDEAPIVEWKECPSCQQKIKDLGLKNERALQINFINEVNVHLKEKNKILIGWNEVLASDNIDRDIVAQYWTAKKDPKVTQHLKAGGKVIMSCHKYFYYDMMYTYCTLKNAYNFEFTRNGVPANLIQNVVGVEGANWTEWTYNEDKLFFSTFPRALALAEIAWTSTYKRDYKDFVARLELQKKLLDQMNIYYGLDFITTKKSILKKKKLAKKYGLNTKDYDYEFKLNKAIESDV